MGNNLTDYSSLSFSKRFHIAPWWARLIIFILAFLQFYPTTFVFFPLSLRVCLSGLGMGVLLLQYLIKIGKGNEVKLDKRFLYILLPLALISLLSMFTNAYNGTKETMYLYYFLTTFLMLGSGYLTILIMHYFYGNHLCFEVIAYYSILAVFGQLIFGLISYLDQPLVMPILLNTKEGLLQIGGTQTGRFIGLGQYFMNLGVANGVGLLLIGILMKNSKSYSLSKFNISVLSLIFISVALLGNMQARTTGICAIIVISYLFMSKIQFDFTSLKAGVGQIVRTVFLIIFLIFFINYFWGDEMKQYSDALNYGFELFLNLDKGHGASTESSDQLKHMLTIWPQQNKTWLIGDGQYFTAGGYYMATDVGYARLLFYFGFIGMIVYFVLQFILSYQAFKNIVEGWQSILFYLILSILIINIKSCVDYTFYIALFYSYNLLYNKNYHSQSESVETESPLDQTQKILS